MQEFYFSGTIERVIFENASNFFRILLLEIDETDSDFEDYEIIVTGTTPNDALRTVKTFC